MRQSPGSLRQRLIAVIRARSFSEGKAVKLASGRSSNFYFNMKPTMLAPEGAELIARLILEELAAERVDFVGGLEMGAVPIAAAVSAASRLLKPDGVKPLPAFFVRKAAKEHGTQSLVEGLAPGESLQGKRVAILEDVTTTGGSALKAVDAVKAAGGEVALVLTIVDREEGASATFSSAGLKFRSLLKASDFR